MIYSATELMLRRFQDEFFPIKKEEYLCFRNYILSSHFFAMYFKGFNTDMTGNTYKAIFSERYPHLVKKTRIFVESLYKASKNPIFLEEDFLLIPYLKNSLFFSDPCQFEVPLTILVESDMPSLMTKNFIRQLRGYFSYLYNVTITDIFETSSKHADVLLTTGNLKDMKAAYPDAQIVVVSKKLSMTDITRINQALEEISENKKKI